MCMDISNNLSLDMRATISDIIQRFPPPSVSETGSKGGGGEQMGKSRNRQELQTIGIDGGREKAREKISCQR